MTGEALTREITKARDETGLPLKDLSVGASDPFRLATPANHRDARWLADTAATLGLGARRIHTRGLHYMVLGQIKPNGEEYVSDDASWEFIESACKAARWLGYIPFDQITDQRNSPPVTRIWTPPQPQAYVGVEVRVDIPTARDIEPNVFVQDFTGTQPYKLVMVGEKSSLDAVLGTIASQYKADLYLPTGDISDTMIHQMAKIGAVDGRPMVVLYFADADPSGWNMGVVISRKLQALKVLHFPDLEYEVHRVALTPDQVREFGLPSTPLKESERRADKWRAAMGVEQTEIDALATLRPDLLRRLAYDAIAPFYDDTLDVRVFRAEADWEARAQEVLDDALDQDRMEQIREQATAKLEELRAEIAAINDALRIDVHDLELPPIVIPGPEPTLGVVGTVAPEPLGDSRLSFVDQTRRLIASRNYLNGGSA